jgi:hypothetical protein
VLVLAILELPRWLASGVVTRWTVRVAFVALALIVYPTLIEATDVSRLLLPVHRFQAFASPRALDSDGRASSERIRPFLPDEPLFLGGDAVSAGEFRDFAEEIRAVVGARKTYVERIGWIAGGLIAFAADLTPAPHPPGGDLLTINDSVRIRIAEHIQAHPADYEALISPSLETPEAQAFVQSHPDLVSLKRIVGPSTVNILLSRP